MNIKLPITFLLGFLVFGAVGTLMATPLTVGARNGNGIVEFGITMSPLDTGIDITAGDILSVAVDPSDTWDLSNGNYITDANGLVVWSSNPSDVGTSGSFTLGGFTSIPGMLTGLIDGTYFNIGTMFTQAISLTGRLQLLMWDSSYLDNHGSIIADVRVRSATEPVTALLLMTGIIAVGFASITRKR